MYTFTSEYTVGDHVSIDGDSSIRAVVTSVKFIESQTYYGVSWVHNGAAVSEWFESWRIMRKEP